MIETHAGKGTSNWNKEILKLMNEPRPLSCVFIRVHAHKHVQMDTGQGGLYAQDSTRSGYRGVCLIVNR